MTAVPVPADRPQRAGESLVGELSRLVAAAFDALPMTRWLVPSAPDRREIMPRYFALLVEHAIGYGRVDFVLGREAAVAVAVWLPTDDPPVPAIPRYDERLDAACGRYAGRFRALDRVMRDSHPDSPSHEHLALLAVHPRWQGNGLGGRLLDHRHRDLDAELRPGYLEAATMRSARLYRRFGYRHVAAPFAPPDCTAAMWPMWRDPGMGTRSGA